MPHTAYIIYVACPYDGVPSFKYSPGASFDQHQRYVLHLSPLRYDQTPYGSSALIMLCVVDGGEGIWNSASPDGPKQLETALR